MFSLTPGDLERLKGVHPDLVRVVKRAATLSPRRFKVLEGMRTVDRQRQLVAKGASKTMNSRHLTGHAVDIAPVDDKGEVSWAWPLYYPLAKVVKDAAKMERVAIEWGGDWKSFKDGPHWQLPWGAYPSTPPKEVARDKPITEPKVNDLGKSRTVKGTVTAAGGGLVVAAASAKEIAAELKDASEHLSTGSVLSLVIGGLIVAGALYALYARLDDAGVFGKKP
jgi:peptidoglycan L-alanyl-D-glutamate endopeptidase CwlK